jgi:hypothetical protein
MMSEQLKAPAWIPCPRCDNFWCTIHGEHVHDCPCPEVGEWSCDPYLEGGPQPKLITISGAGEMDGLYAVRNEWESQGTVNLTLSRVEGS